MCKLCGARAPLQQSHIIPKFIGKWIKETSPTPYFRFGMDMERRHQDLLKIELLCHNCEERFSALETKFANEIFHPSVAGNTTFRYHNWFVKFASSLAWRTLNVRDIFAAEEQPVVKSICDMMELHLRSFLLGRKNHVGAYTQHVYQLGELADPPLTGSPYLNRYLQRVVEIDFPRNDDLSEVMVYVKLPMFIFLSVGVTKNRELMETSRIKKSGQLRPNDHTLPDGFLDYLLSRSDRMGQLLNEMSPKSKAMSDKSLMKAIDEDRERVVNSEQFQAMLVDYEFYGKDAVIRQDT